MNSRSLEEDLLDIAGVEGAEVDGSGISPAGLRIRIAEGADQHVVGGEIRRVLTKHGLGTDTRLPGEDSPGEGRTAADDEVSAVETVIEGASEEESEEESTEPAAASVAVLAPPIENQDEIDSDAPHDDSLDKMVIDLTGALANEEDNEAVEDSENTDTEADEDAGRSDTEPTILAVEASAAPGSWSESSQGTMEQPESQEAAAQRETVRQEPQQPPAAVIARIDHVAVAEGLDGISVTVSLTDGRSESQPASSTEGGVETAVVMAAARLAQPGIADPLIIEIEDRRVEGVDIVMIVLDSDGTVAAGSAIVGAGRSFALGRATWAALSL